ncbi:MAG: hypothetical protein ACFCD0_21840 [Gemmataceae bacterium]
MPPQVCPRCKRTNPDAAAYCYYDGSVLGELGAPNTTQTSNSLLQEFHFPSGVQCRTIDELAQACQMEWEAAKDLLMGGYFQHFFANAGRDDLARVSYEAMSVDDRDIALASFLKRLPTSKPLGGPKLDLRPRRLLIEKVRSGETRKVGMTIVNRGKGKLQGTLSIVEGQEWLKLNQGISEHQIQIQTDKEQVIEFVADSHGLPAGQSFGAKLRVITNGGVVEAPVQITIVAFPFPRQPFQGALSARDLARRMSKQPKAAAPLLESGEIAKWFASNGWAYPVIGTPAKGVAGVQQFFEVMGLMKPPALSVSHPTLELTCLIPKHPRVDIVLQTPEKKKYVYANVYSDVPWLQVLTPQVGGREQAVIRVEVEPTALPEERITATALQLVTNGGRKMNIPVRVSIVRPRPTFLSRFLVPVMVFGLLLLLTRGFLSPIIDFYARPTAVHVAITKTAKSEKDIPNHGLGSWLSVPWGSVLTSANFELSETVVPEDALGTIREKQDFRDYLVSAFVRTVTVSTWWVGALLWVLVLFRREGVLNALWGVVSGSILGVILSASMACLVLVVETVPHSLWAVVVSQEVGSAGLLLGWSLFATVFWGTLGSAIAIGLVLLGPIGRPWLTFVQNGIASLLREFGLENAAQVIAAQ